MKQYEIWWAQLPNPVGRRPVLLLTRSAAYEFLSHVTIVEITSTIRHIPQEVILGPRDGLPRHCVANFDNIHAVDKSNLKKKIGRLAAGRERQIKHAFGYALGWPELTDNG